MGFRLSRVAFAAVAGACAGVAAQQAQPMRSASAPAAADRPALQDYRAFSEVGLLPWKDPNDTVARIGGWRAYAREAQAGSSAPAAPASAPGGPRAADPHGSHHRRP